MRHLPATGLLDTVTLRTLNGPTNVDIVEANMERWRWMPRELGADRVVVNIPDYSMRATHDGVRKMISKVVVGTPDHPTPIISNSIVSLTINPIWNVPATIAENEYLPRLKVDPTYAERNNFQVVRNQDGTFHLYQLPGNSNALGRIRINFPNKFFVYQHDTPDKELFAEARRAYSHGCIRVQHAFNYAEILLSMTRKNEKLTVAQLYQMLGPNEVNIELAEPVPIHLIYQTAWVDEAGALQFRHDVYGYDRRMKEAFEQDARERSKRRIAEKSIAINGVRSLSPLQWVIRKFKWASRRVMANVASVLP